MSFLAPLALLGAAIIGPIIVAMYLLKLRREERIVPSTFLWQKMVRDVEANAPWQRLRRNILLLLQLLILALLVLALARPFFRTAGIAGRNLIVILDRSASMGATDAANQTRLEAAKQQAITLVDQLPDGGRATIIAAGGQMDVPAASTNDRRQLRDAINSISLRYGGSDLAQPLTLASALASREAESEVAIISDGNVRVPAEIQVPATVRYFPVGTRNSNVAMSALNVQPSAAGQTLFAQATNYGTAPVTRRMDIYLDGSLFNAYNLELGPGQAAAQTIEIPAQVGVVEARLAESADDSLPIDDQAWAVSNVGDGTRVRIVGPGNRFLNTALSLLPSIQTTTVPTSTATFTETAAEVPLTILDGVVPSTLPPGNLFFIAPPRSTEFFSVTGQIEFPALRPANGEDQLLRDVSLSDVNVSRAVTIVPGSWARTVVDGDAGPVLVAGERDGRRIVVLSFDIHQSDLPLQVAFPLLISNIVSYLVPGSGADAAQLTPGQPLAIPIDATITDVRITKPDGSTVSALRENGQAIFADTEALGPYTVEQYQGQKLVGRTRYAVNLFSADESTIGPKAELNVTQASGLQQAETNEQNRVGRQEIWRWLAALALIVLVIEWLVYQRNGLAYLRERFRRTQVRSVK